MTSFRVPACRRHAPLFAALLLSHACRSDSISIATPDGAASAGALFANLADSVARAGGDTAMVQVYAGIADAVKAGGRVSRITITVDGVPTSFLATAQQTEATVPVTICLAITVCPQPGALPPLRALIAWQESNPKRVVQLSSLSDADPIKAYLVPTFAGFPTPVATFVYFDGGGGSWFGTSGTQKFGIVPSKVSCTAVGAIAPRPGSTPTCTTADFTVAFSATAEPSTFLARNNTATGSRTFVMGSQAVLGALLQLSASLPPQPPIVVTPFVLLPSTLTIRVDTLVSLSFTVGSAVNAPAVISFPTSQQFDVAIHDAASSALVWRWSDGMGFLQAFTSRTIAANGSFTYTASWRPVRKGAFVAVGNLVSVSHRADAKQPFTVP